MYHHIVLKALSLLCLIAELTVTAQVCLLQVVYELSTHAVYINESIRYGLTHDSFLPPHNVCLLLYALYNARSLLLFTLTNFIMTTMGLMLGSLLNLLIPGRLQAILLFCIMVRILPLP
jgi:hypothetical protein